jgi:cytochrome b-561
MALIGLHLAVMIKQKHTQPRYAERVAPGKILGVPMYPQQMVMMGILFALYVGIMTMIAGAFLAHPVEAFGPPTPNTPAVKPDWYFLWLYGLLQLIPSSWEFHLFGATIGPEFIGGVIIPGILGIVALLLPFVDTRKDKMRYMELPSEHPVRTSAILALLVFFLMSTLAGYKIDFQQQGSLLGNNAVLWTLVLGGPLLTFFLAYTLMRIFYGKKEEEKAL